MKAWTYQKNSDTIGILADYFIQQEEFMYKAIFFDLDGTLTESGEGITKSVQYALEKLGVSAPDLEPLIVFVTESGIQKKECMRTQFIQAWKTLWQN